MTAKLTIEVYVDLICPWCLIGKRHLDEALAQFHATAPHVEVCLVWHSVQLLPQAPQDGWDFNTFYLQRLGGPEPLLQRQAQVNAAAQQVGFQIDFSRIPRMPNTRRVHQLLAFASERLSPTRYADLLERLFAAHFRHAEDLGNLALLQGIAAEAGLDSDTLAQWITTGLGLPEQQSVPGVPFFVFNHSHALSGAQPASVLLAAMQASQRATEECI